MMDYAAQNAMRDAKVLAAALNLSRLYGYRSWTRQDVAQAAGVSAGSVSNYNGGATIEQLRDAVVREAVQTECLPVIAAALTDRHPDALAAPESLRARALASILAE